VIVLAFTHTQQGHHAAIRFLRGFIPGMWSAAVFCAVVAVAIGPLGKASAFLLALGAIAMVLVLMWFCVARREVPDRRAFVTPLLRR
jgi:ABC-type transport system involved in cytochrome bd biosynthesis fused ATPase/permease subunit